MSVRSRYPPNPNEEAHIPAPSHRHAAPSGPWPWMDLESEVDPVQLSSPLPPVPPLCDHTTCGGCWVGYPQSRFPNWTPDQVKRSGIRKAIREYAKDVPCVIHHVDVDNTGFFSNAERHRVTDSESSRDDLWKALTQAKRPEGVRVRALFVENMSGPVLQMLGARYNIEPFFFSSSLNWIPSRFQEAVQPKQGDHITITLTFLRPMPPSSRSSQYESSSSTKSVASEDKSSHMATINTQTPLLLRTASSERLLALDLLAVHFIRTSDSSTIISYHPNRDQRTTSATNLHSRIRFAGQSVYWQNIFQQSPDPTFVLLTFVWHALYAWDEALEALYTHICWLESQVIITSDMDLTHELHIIRAHHLHYFALLQDFRKTVDFILGTPNPAMDALPEAERKKSRELLERECANLLSEVGRLEMSRTMQDRRLKNVMNLVFSSVNIVDSKRMQRLTEAAVRDSAAMKQISYLTMVFLPASFAAAVFGMNIKEINPSSGGTLPQYFAAAIPMTVLTVWVIVAFQSTTFFDDPQTSLWMKLTWPFVFVRRMLGRGGKVEESEESIGDELEKSGGFSLP